MEPRIPPSYQQAKYVCFLDFLGIDMGVSKNRGTPKCMVYNGNPYIEMDDLGVPRFSETPICVEDDVATLPNT